MSGPTYRILFVCMGNICRSPAGEGVLRHLVKEAGLADRIEIDSCGTLGYHAGNPPDRRMTVAAHRRGYRLAGAARAIEHEDLASFDLILTMDKENFRNVSRLDPNGQFAEKIRPFCEFCTGFDDTEVPDPYYGAAGGFEHVLDLLEDGCQDVLTHARAALGLSSPPPQSPS